MADAQWSESSQADFDTTGGEALREVSGIIVPASGGPLTVTGGLMDGTLLSAAGIGLDIRAGLYAFEAGGSNQFKRLTVNSTGLVVSAVVQGDVGHDSADIGFPLKTGGYASAAAPSAVSADGDRVNAWYLRNGAQAAVLTAAGALIGGDATNGLDVDVTRLPALVAGTANIGDVDVATVPAPLSTTGNGTAATALRVTIASDTTGVVAVTDNGGSLTVDGTVAATQSGTWTAVGPTASDAALTANPQTVGGRASTAVPTAVSADGDVVDARFLRNGALVVHVVDSAGAAQTFGGGAVGGGTEATALRVTVATDSTGVLSIDDNGGSLTVDGTVAVTGVATAANQTTELASLAAIESDADAIRIGVQLIDDTVQVLGTDTYTEATSKGITLGAVRRDADTTLVGTTNEFGPLQMDANGRLKVEAFSGETLPVSGTFWQATQPVSGTFWQATQPISVAASLAVIGPTAADAALTVAPQTIGGRASTAVPTAVSADGDVVNAWLDRQGAQFVRLTDAAGAAIATGVQYVEADTDASIQGTAILWEDTSDTLRAVSAAKPLPVSLAALPALVAGSANIGDVDIATMPNVTLAAGTNTNEVVGDAAADAAIAGNPVAIGMRASTAVPSAMSADGDVVFPWANRSGAQMVSSAPHIGLNSDPWNLVHEGVQYNASQTSAVIIAGGASEKIVVTQIQIGINGTAAGHVTVYFGTGAFARGTNRTAFDGPFAPTATNAAQGVVETGPFIAGANGDDLMITTTTGADVLTVSVWYYVVV